MELTRYAEGKSLSTGKFVLCSSMLPCVQMAVDGMGIALLPRTLVEKQLKAKRLFEIEIDWTPPPLRFAARFQSEKVAKHITHAAGLAEEVATNFRNSNSQIHL